MHLHELDDRELATAHSEMLAKAQAARNEGDLDLAQRYLGYLRPMNAEMYARHQLRWAS